MGRCRGSDDAVLGQLVQLQVIEGLPGANNGDVCVTKHSKHLDHSADQRRNT